LGKKNVFKQCTALLYFLRGALLSEKRGCSGDLFFGNVETGLLHFAREIAGKLNKSKERVLREQKVKKSLNW